MKSNLATIIRKELSRFFTDRKLFTTTVIMPGLMIYIIYTLMGGMFGKILTTDEDYVYNIQAVNMPKNVAALLQASEIPYEAISMGDVEGAKTAIAEGSLDLCMVFPENFEADVLAYDITDVTNSAAAPEVTMYYNSGETASFECYQVMVATLDAYENSMSNKFNVNSGEETYDLKEGTDIVSRMMTAIIPMLFLTMLFSGCCAIAPDFIAGEKERGTIATLLVTPMKRSSLALGKIISMSVMTLLSGISSFIGVALSLPKLANMGEDMSFFDFSGLGAFEYVLLLLLVLSVTLVLIALLSMISAQAKTVKESATAIGPLNIVVMVIGIAGGYLGTMDTNVLTSLVPIYNFSKCMAAIFCGTVDLPSILVAIGSNLVYTALFTFILTKMFDNEKVMFSN